MEPRLLDQVKRSVAQIASLKEEGVFASKDIVMRQIREFPGYTIIVRVLTDEEYDQDNEE